MTAFLRLKNGNLHQCPGSDLKQGYKYPHVLGATKISREVFLAESKKSKTAKSGVGNKASEIGNMVADALHSNDRPSMRTLYAQVVGNEAAETGATSKLMYMAATILAQSSKGASPDEEADPVDEADPKPKAKVVKPAAKATGKAAG